VLEQCIQCAAHLLSDEVPATAKQAVLSANLLFRIALALVAAQVGNWVSWHIQKPNLATCTSLPAAPLQQALNYFRRRRHD
jgi:hypothetical protein